jgi:hypothetical protein
MSGRVESRTLVMPTRHRQRITVRLSLAKVLFALFGVQRLGRSVHWQKLQLPGCNCGVSNRPARPLTPPATFAGRCSSRVPLLLLCVLGTSNAHAQQQFMVVNVYGQACYNQGTGPPNQCHVGATYATFAAAEADLFSDAKAAFATNYQVTGASLTWTNSAEAPDPPTSGAGEQPTVWVTYQCPGGTCGPFSGADSAILLATVCGATGQPPCLYPDRNFWKPRVRSNRRLWAWGAH